MASLARFHGANRLFFGWLSSTAGYVPSNEARISSSDMALHKRVLSCGCYPFLSGRSEYLSVFLASLSASTKGVIASANRSAFTLSQSLTTPFADPLAGLKDRNLRDTDAYTENIFWGQTFMIFCVFYFFGIYFLRVSPAQRLVSDQRSRCTMAANSANPLKIRKRNQ